MAIKKKISQLPECRDFNGLYTIGVDGSRKSVKVSLGYIAEVVSGMQEATTAANNAAQNADRSRQQIESNETTRQQNEQTRISQENARVQAETNRQTTWTNWFSDTLATGVRKLWNDFWSSINNSWNGFFGTSAEDANGVRKIWSTWYASVQSSWTSFFGSNPNGGVRGEWASLKTDAQNATNAANQKAALANEKAILANEKASLANEKAILANEKASLANNAADNANTQAGRANDARVLIMSVLDEAETAIQECEGVTDQAREVIAAASEVEGLGLIPTGLEVSYPAHITLGNKSELRIGAKLTPSIVQQNIIFIADNDAVSVGHDGTIHVNKVGKSIVHIIPTMKTAIARSVMIEVVMPSIRKVTASSMRLDSSGNIRLN